MVSITVVNIWVFLFIKLFAQYLLNGEGKHCEVDFDEWEKSGHVLENYDWIQSKIIRNNLDRLYLSNRIIQLFHIRRYEKIMSTKILSQLFTICYIRQLHRLPASPTLVESLPGTVSIKNLWVFQNLNLGTYKQHLLSELVIV